MDIEPQMRIISYVCCIGLLFLPIFSVVFYPGSLNMTVQFMSVKWSPAEGIRQMLLSLSPEKAASPWRWDPFILAQSPCPPLACLLKNVTKAPYRLKVPWSHYSSLASAMHVILQVLLLSMQSTSSGPLYLMLCPPSERLLRKCSRDSLARIIQVSAQGSPSQKGVTL